MARLGGDLREGPPPGQVARQDELDPVDRPPAAGAGGRSVGGALPDRAPYQGQSQAFGFQRFGDLPAQAVPEQSHQGLGPRVDPPPLPPEPELRGVVEEGPRRELAQERLADHQVQAGVATRDRVAHAIALVRVEEQDLVGLRHRVVLPQVPDVEAAIGEDEVQGRRGLLRPRGLAGTPAAHVPDDDGRRLQQRLGDDLRPAGFAVHAGNLGPCQILRIPVSESRPRHPICSSDQPFRDWN